MSNKHYLVPILFLFVLIVPVLIWKLGDPGPSGEKPGETAQQARTGDRNSKAKPGRPSPAAKSRLGNLTDLVVPTVLSAELKQIVGDDSTLTPRQRIDWLRANGSGFTPTDADAIVAYLASGKVPEELTPQQWHWLVDELLTTLRESSKDPQRLSKQLALVFYNNGLDPVVRDYVLQHLGHLGQEGGDLQVIRDAALTGLEETGTPMAGTALLVLHNEETPNAADAAGADNPALPPLAKDPGMLALDILNQEQASVASRVTALQVASNRGTEGAYAAAIAVLRTDAPYLLQIAAVAAVAETGTPGDVALLDQAGSRNPRLRNAVHNATVRLTEAN